jgi:2,5-diketo-D-gluconate reductase A
VNAPTIPLRDGAAIPQIGFGVFQISAADMGATLETAFGAGYRHIDTAVIYGNERAVGSALAECGIPRDELFVTTKVWNDAHSRAGTRQSLQESLERLQLEQLDLLLIHWPAPANGRFVEAWEGLLELQSEGLVRSVGVSNFRVEDLEQLIAASGSAPVINQIELHPYFQQTELRAFHDAHDIVTEAWSPLALGGALLQDPTVSAIATAHGRTPAQVVLRWHTQSRVVAIPKSVTPHRIRENFDVFDFSLSSADMLALTALDRGQRTGAHPDDVN